MQFGSSALQYKKRTKVQIGEDEYERETDTFYAGQIRYRSIIEVSSDHGIGGSSFIGVFRRNRGEHAFIYFRLGSRDLLLFSDIFKKCTEAVRRKSGISYENIQDKKLVSESKKHLAAEKSVPHLYMSVM